MAYGAKWEFKFDSTNGVETLIRISKDGYSGSAVKRPLGSAPVIKQSQNGCIKTTSLSLQVECHVDGEFSEFYTTNPRAFKVEVYRSNTPVFEGFLVTEIFSEPLIAPPYDVSINAVDGLSELKMVDFVPTGTQKLITHLKNLLDNTGAANAIQIVSGLRFGGDTAINFVKNAKINLDYMEGKTCYEVLEYILRTLHATVQWYADRWLIIRENDVVVSNNGSVGCYFVNRSGTVSSTSVDYVTAAITKYNTVPYWSYRPNMWPVGYLTRRVDPAKKTVAVEAPWNLNDGTMYPSVEDDGWTITGTNVTFDSTHKCYVFGINTQGGLISADAIVINSNYDVEVKVKASCGTGATPYGSKIMIGAKLEVSGVGTYYYSPTNGWTTTSATAFESNMNGTNYNHAIEDADDFSFTLPAAFLGGGTLTLSINGMVCEIYSITAEVKMNKGYKDIILINNGARGEADTVEIGGGRVTSSSVMSLDCLQGIWLDSSTVAYAFSDNNNTNKDFLSITALDYARSVAAPRTRIQGVLDVPAASLLPPLILLYSSIEHLIETFDWDLLNDEITVDALALPSVTLQVTGETIKPLE